MTSVVVWGRATLFLEVSARHSSSIGSVAEFALIDNATTKSLAILLEVDAAVRTARIWLSVITGGLTTLRSENEWVVNARYRDRDSCKEK